MLRFKDVWITCRQSVIKSLSSDFELSIQFELGSKSTLVVTFYDFDAQISTNFVFFYRTSIINHLVSWKNHYLPQRYFWDLQSSWTPRARPSTPYKNPITKLLPYPHHDNDLHYLPNPKFIVYQLPQSVWKLSTLLLPPRLTCRGRNTRM